MIERNMHEMKRKLIALLILFGVQIFFFGFLLQIIKDIKYRIDRIDRNKK